MIGKPTGQQSAFAAAEFRDVRPAEPCDGTRWLNQIERCPWCEQRATDRNKEMDN